MAAIVLWVGETGVTGVNQRSLAGYTGVTLRLANWVALAEHTWSPINFLWGYTNSTIDRAVRPRLSQQREKPLAIWIEPTSPASLALKDKHLNPSATIHALPYYTYLALRMELGRLVSGT